MMTPRILTARNLALGTFLPPPGGRPEAAPDSSRRDFLEIPKKLIQFIGRYQVRQHVRVGNPDILFRIHSHLDLDHVYLTLPT